MTNHGRLRGSAVEHLPSAQGVIRGPGTEAHVGLPAGTLLLFSLCPVLCLCLSGVNK